VKIAVVGGGLFGCTAAFILQQNGHEVHLYEKNGAIFGAASGINQYRLHKGYHYPRSNETVRECLQGLAAFKRYFGESVIGGVERYYAIAAKGSQTSKAKYLSFLDANGLPYKIEKPMCKELDLFVRVEEERVCPSQLRNICAKKMALAGVEIFLNAPAYKDMRDDYDQIVVSGYAGNNDILKTLGCSIKKYQYEVCEKPVIALNRISEWFRDFSLVVMDGNFCSVDPLGHTGWHVMGHVEHAIHSRNVGYAPEVPARLKKYLDQGRIHKPIGSRYQKMKKASKKYMPFLDEALYQGSMFTTRVVLPRKDKTDERPTIVERIDDKVIKIFSGKLGTAVEAAHTTLALVQTNRRTECRPAAPAASPNGRTTKTCKSPLEVQPNYARLAKQASAAKAPRP